MTIALEGWPEGEVLPSTYMLPVVPRKPLPKITVSPEQRRVWSADAYSIDQLQFTPDGKTFVVMMTRRIPAGRVYQFRLWDAVTETERCKFFQIDPEPSLVIYTPFLAISADSKRLAIRYNVLRSVPTGKTARLEESGQLRVFDLESGNQLWQHDGQGWSITGADFSSDGEGLVTSHFFSKRKGGGQEPALEFMGEIRFWDAWGGQRASNLAGGPYKLPALVDDSQDGKYLMFQEWRGDSDQGGYLGVWDLSEQKLALKVPGQNAVGVVSPNGRQLAVSTSIWNAQEKTYSRGAKVFELQTGQEKESLSLPVGNAALAGLSWSNDGKHVFLSSAAGQLWRWDPVGVEPLVTVESIVAGPSDGQTARDARSWDVHLGSPLYAFAVNGLLPERMTRRNLADDYDELPPPEIVLWDLRAMQRRATLNGHRGQVNDLAFSSDGLTLVSGGTDGTIRFWAVDGVPGK